jgi:fumarylacetoacetase
MGIFVGKANKLGQPVKCKDAKDHIFGFVVLNDWSARDI